MYLQIIRFYSFRPRLFWHFWCSQVHSRTLGDLFLRPQTPAAAPSASASRCLGRTCSTALRVVELAPPPTVLAPPQQHCSGSALVLNGNDHDVIYLDFDKGVWQSGPRNTYPQAASVWSTRKVIKMDWAVSHQQETIRHHKWFPFNACSRLEWRSLRVSFRSYSFPSLYKLPPMSP